MNCSPQKFHNPSGYLISLALLTALFACSNEPGNQVVTNKSEGTSIGSTDQQSTQFPFPNEKGPGEFCKLPASANSQDAKAIYEQWKTRLVTTYGANGYRRVSRPDSPFGMPSSSVSEGIASGMILSVIFDDQSLFDDLFKYSQHWADDTGLMNWYVGQMGQKACPGLENCGSASDADGDMAFALISADKQWGGKGTLEKSYREYALRQIELVKAFDIHATGIVKPGNHWGGPENLNLSYFSPAFYKIFGEYSEDKPFWDDVIDINYEALFNSLNEENGNHENGLPPAWSNIDGEPIVPYDGATSHFQTISARIPFRIAQHYCWYGDQRAKEYLNKINNFFTSIGHDKLTDGYNLDGTIRPEAAPPHSSMSAVVVGAAAVAAMADGSYPKFIDGAYNLVKTGKLLVRDTYYQLSWTGLTMAFMTGNYVDMTRQ